MALPASLHSGVNTASTVLGVPLLLALVTFQVECRAPQKYMIRGAEKSLYMPDSSFSGRLSVEQSLSRKEAYRGRRRRKRRPVNSNYVHSYGPYKKARSRPRRPPPPVQEFPEELDDLGEELGYSEDIPIRTRPWTNHLYSASIRTREPPRPRPPQDTFYQRYRGKKPRQPIGGLTYYRDPEDLDNRWNDYREEFPPHRNPEWEAEDNTWEQDRTRDQIRDEYMKYYGKNQPWRDNREGVRTQVFKNNAWNNGDVVPTQQLPAYQVWSEDAGNQDDIEVQVKYPVWMDDSKSEDWQEQLFPGYRRKQKYQQDGRLTKQRPALNQDLESHVIQPAKAKTKFRSGIGQNLNIRGQNKEINWELETPYQHLKAPEIGWEDAKPFEAQNAQWNEQKPVKNYQWGQKKIVVNNKDGQWDESNKDYAWSETSSPTNQDYWADSSTTSTSQAYPHWDSAQQYYQDRVLRQQNGAQAKMDKAQDEHDTTSDPKLPASSK